MAPFPRLPLDEAQMLAEALNGLLLPPLQPHLKPSPLRCPSPSSSLASLGSLPLPLLPPTPPPSGRVPEHLRAEENTSQCGPGREQGPKRKKPELGGGGGCNQKRLLGGGGIYGTDWILTE